MEILIPPTLRKTKCSALKKKRRIDQGVESTSQILTLSQDEIENALSQPFSQVSLNDSVIKNDLKEKCLEEIAEEDEFIDDLEEDDNMDLINPSCYANIDGISIFFQKNEKIHLVFF